MDPVHEINRAQQELQDFRSLISSLVASTTVVGDNPEGSWIA